MPKKYLTGLSMQDSLYVYHNYSYRRDNKGRARKRLMSIDLVSHGFYLCSIRKAESKLDRYRFANFSKNPLPYKTIINLEGTGTRTTRTRLLLWLRNETTQWNFEVKDAIDDFLVTPLPLCISFSDPKDAVIFKLYQEQILSGEKRPRNRPRPIKKLTHTD